MRPLASTYRSIYVNIYGGIDDWLDCPNDDFRMTTLYCEGESDAEVIWQLGYELISLFIAVPERMKYTPTERSLAAYELRQLTCTSSA